MLCCINRRDHYLFSIVHAGLVLPFGPGHGALVTWCRRSGRRCWFRLVALQVPQLLYAQSFSHVPSCLPQVMRSTAWYTCWMRQLLLSLAASPLTAWSFISTFVQYSHRHWRSWFCLMGWMWAPISFAIAVPFLRPHWNCFATSESENITLKAFVNLSKAKTVD